MAAATSPMVVDSGPGRSGRATESGIRADIQGLRAVAVLLVLAYHAGVPFLPGGFVGVDVFFVVSGFLITGLIVREITATGGLDLGRFYARRVKRLLPATAMTFVGVAALTLAVLPATRWPGIAQDMVASTLYVVNWRLAGQSVDYLASDVAASPLQHFWSLAVEEQFYIVWPVLIVALAWRTRRNLSTRHLVTGLLLIAVPSLLWSIYLTRTAPGPAFFATTTRLWELALGALLAVTISRVALVPAVVRTVVGWCGLVAIFGSALLITAQTPFPGVAALVPTLGTAAVLFAGSAGSETRVRALDAAPLQEIGALSYSLYLWHWPLLVVAASVWGGEQGILSVPMALLVVGFSAVPAWLAYRAVERPLHRSRVLAAQPWRAAAVGGVCVLVGLGSAAIIHASVASTRTPAGPDERLGAVALGASPTASSAGIPVDAVTTITPAPVDAAADNADVYADGCHQDAPSSVVLTCVYGDESSSTVIALVGDSHAAQWQPGLRLLAETNGWRLETYTKSACLFADVEVRYADSDRPYSSCEAWSAGVVDRLSADVPDVVVVTSAGNYRLADAGEPRSTHDSFDALASGMSRSWEALRDAGSAVTVLVDTPWPDVDMPECVARNLDSLELCAVPRTPAVDRSAAALQRAAAKKVQGARVVDLTDFVCPQVQCAPVIGGVLVFRDMHHLTGTYAKTLAPMLAQPMREAIAAS